MCFDIVFADNPDEPIATYATHVEAVKAREKLEYVAAVEFPQLVGKYIIVCDSRVVY